jgi:hypothetical protein
MNLVSKLEAESLKLCGYKVIKTKHRYYLTGRAVRVLTGYSYYL